MMSSAVLSTPTLHRSLLSLDVNHPAVRDALADFHHMHRLVMSGWDERMESVDFFAETHGHANQRERLGVLHAMSGVRDGRIYLITQGHQAPRWDNPATSYWADALTTAPDTTIRTPETAGTVLRFELRANVVAPHPTDRGRRVPIRDLAAQRDWFQHRLALAGLGNIRLDRHDSALTLESAYKNAQTRRAHSQHRRSGTFTVYTVRVQGLATVVDDALHQTALATGIGRSKAFGCGLLLTRTN